MKYVTKNYVAALFKLMLLIFTTSSYAQEDDHFLDDLIDNANVNTSEESAADDHFLSDLIDDVNQGANTPNTQRGLPSMLFDTRHMGKGGLKNVILEEDEGWREQEYDSFEIIPYYDDTFSALFPELPKNAKERSSLSSSEIIQLRKKHFLATRPPIPGTTVTIWYVGSEGSDPERGPNYHLRWPIALCAREPLVDDLFLNPSNKRIHVCHNLLKQRPFYHDRHDGHFENHVVFEVTNERKIKIKKNRNSISCYLEKSIAKNHDFCLNVTYELNVVMSVYQDYYDEATRGGYPNKLYSSKYATIVLGWHNIPLPKGVKLDKP
ncbi:MAG: hypothetical protein OXC40_00135 [Proteobacteria bacterium]|nr:hypothetical protein [Pseudomonadota bacterium]